MFMYVYDFNKLPDHKNTWLWNELLCLVRTVAITMNQTSSKKCGISFANCTLTIMRMFLNKSFSRKGIDSSSKRLLSRA